MDATNAETAYREFSSRRCFRALDGVRALAILSVVWHHADRGRELPWGDEGSVGVELFFVVSGFLITTLLLRERDRTGDISLPAFYARRSLRIFPLYYSVLLFYVLAVTILPVAETDRARFFGNLKFFATYTSNWFVTLDDGRVIFFIAWSLATEEQFYLLWPSVEKQLGRLRRWYPVAVAVLLIVVWAAVKYHFIPVERGPWRRMLVGIAPAISAGVILAHLLHDRRTFARLWPVLGRRLASVGFLGAAVALVLLGLEHASYLPMALFVGACVVREDAAMAPVLTSSPMASIGQVSYGIYLFHTLALRAVERGVRAVGLAFDGVPQAVVVFALAVPLVWGAALVSYHRYESIFLRWKDRFRPGVERSTAPPRVVGAGGAVPQLAHDESPRRPSRDRPVGHTGLPLGPASG